MIQVVFTIDFDSSGRYLKLVPTEKGAVHVSAHQQVLDGRLAYELWSPPGATPERVRKQIEARFPILTEDQARLARHIATGLVSGEAADETLWAIFFDRVIVPPRQEQYAPWWEKLFKAEQKFYQRHLKANRDHYERIRPKRGISARVWSTEVE